MHNILLIEFIKTILLIIYNFIHTEIKYLNGLYKLQKMEWQERVNFVIQESIQEEPIKTTFKWKVNYLNL